MGLQCVCCNQGNQLYYPLYHCTVGIYEFYFELKLLPFISSSLNRSAWKCSLLINSEPLRPHNLHSPYPFNVGFFVCSKTILARTCKICQQLKNSSNSCRFQMCLGNFHAQYLNNIVFMATKKAFKQFTKTHKDKLCSSQSLCVDQMSLRNNCVLLVTCYCLC